MKVRFNTWMGVCVIGVTVVMSFLGLAMTSSIPIYLVLPLFIGVMLLRGPGFIFEEGRLFQYNIIGMRLKSWTMDQLSIVGESGRAKAVYAEGGGGKTKKLFSSGSLLYKRDDITYLTATLERSLTEHLGDRPKNQSLFRD